jgi:hypothetical protein
VFRPHRIRWVAGIAAAAVVVLFTLLSFGLHGSTGDGPGQFERGDQTAMIGLGVLAGLGILTFCRPRVIADAERIRVRNVLGDYDLPWSVVRAVRFERDSAWATLLLTNGDEVSLLAVQAVDGERALAAVEGLRALLAAARGAAPSPGTRE